VEEKSGIKVYNGILLETKDDILKNIEYYSSSVKTQLFENLCSSTLAIRGAFTNIDFKDEAIIHKINLSDDPKIIKIGCNQEEIYVFPNNYIDYNIANIIDIIKNSKSKKFKTRIGCNCQNLLDHREYILKIYDIIKKKIEIVRENDFVKKLKNVPNEFVK